MQIARWCAKSWGSATFAFSSKMLGPWPLEPAQALPPEPLGWVTWCHDFSMLCKACQNRHDANVHFCRRRSAIDFSGSRGLVESCCQLGAFSGFEAWRRRGINDGQPARVPLTTANEPKPCRRANHTRTPPLPQTKKTTHRKTTTGLKLLKTSITHGF